MFHGGLSKSSRCIVTGLRIWPAHLVDAPRGILPPTIRRRVQDDRCPTDGPRQQPPAVATFCRQLDAIAFRHPGFRSGWRSGPPDDAGMEEPATRTRQDGPVYPDPGSTGQRRAPFVRTQGFQSSARPVARRRGQISGQSGTAGNRPRHHLRRSAKATGPSPIAG